MVTSWLKMPLYVAMQVLPEAGTVWAQEPALINPKKSVAIDARRIHIAPSRKAETRLPWLDATGELSQLALGLRYPDFIGKRGEFFRSQAFSILSSQSTTLTAPFYSSRMSKR